MRLVNRLCHARAPCLIALALCMLSCTTDRQPPDASSRCRVACGENGRMSTGMDCGACSGRTAPHTPDASEGTPIYYAAVRGDNDVVARLVDRLIHEPGASPAGWTNVICELATEGCTKELRRLLDAGGSASSVGSDGLSALHCAAWGGFPGTVALLLDHEADANRTSEAAEGASPLHMAAARGDPDIVQRLIEHGAAVDSRDRHGITPLACAVRIGRRSTVARLIERGADVNLPIHLNGIEQPPLVMALDGPYRDWDMIELLIRAGAAPYVDIAGTRHYYVDLLRDAGESAAADELDQRIRKAGKGRPGP